MFHLIVKKALYNISAIIVTRIKFYLSFASLPLGFAACSARTCSGSRQVYKLLVYSFTDSMSKTCET